MTVVDLLRDARKRYAAAPSHAPRGERVPTGQVCLVMAFTEAVMSNHSADFAAELVFCTANRIEDTVDWNAEHSTEEVLEAFDRAIAEAGA